MFSYLQSRLRLSSLRDPRCIHYFMFGTKLKLKIKVEYQYRYFMFGTELEIKEKYSDGRQILRTGEI